MKYLSTDFQRDGSTLGVMDDLQIALHSYDGCPRGCAGCIVDKEFKNKQRFKPILSRDQLALVNARVKEYYDWARSYLNTKSHGYFGANGYKVNHYSYTFRFGNHAELSEEVLYELASSVDSGYRVFSVGAPGADDLLKFKKVSLATGGLFFLEIIYDPFVDKPEQIRDAILGMRSLGINGYPELLVTKKLVDHYSPRRFVDECISAFGDIGAQIQFGRYSPSKTRGYSKSQMVDLDQEVEWLTEVSRLVTEADMDIHPIPLGEYAVTFLDEYGERVAVNHDGDLIISAPEKDEPFNPEEVKEKVRDIFLTSLYIDEFLDVYIWSESVGQHVLDKNFGYKPIGNIYQSGLIEMVTGNKVIESMLNDVVRDLVTNKKCSPCRYKSFCASHAIGLFRKHHADNGKHCYGYLPVIREYQKHPKFLKRMVDGFKELGF